MQQSPENRNPWQEAWRRFRSDKLAMLALAMLAILVMTALLAPLLANPRPFLEYHPETGWSMPFLRSFFAPESTEYCIEQIFNYALLTLIVVPLSRCFIRRKTVRKITTAILLILSALPFILVQPKLERVNYRNTAIPDGGFRIMAILPYGPFEQISEPLHTPCQKHRR